MVEKKTLPLAELVKDIQTSWEIPRKEDFETWGTRQ